MKWRVVELNLTNQQSSQLRSICVLYIWAVWSGKQQFRNHVAWVNAAIVACSFLSMTNRNRTTNNNITAIAHYICFPHQEPGRGVVYSQWVDAVVTIFSCFIQLRIWSQLAVKVILDCYHQCSLRLSQAVMQLGVAWCRHCWEMHSSRSNTLPDWVQWVKVDWFCIVLRHCWWRHTCQSETCSSKEQMEGLLMEATDREWIFLVITNTVDCVGKLALIQVL